MKVSIAMATWMGEKYLEEQLQSFLEQTRLPDELVVRDDDSSDRTPEILRQFADEAPFPVRILPGKSRLGYTANFEKALACTTGDLIFLCDQDDVWFPRRIQTILQIVTDNPEKLLFINDVENVDEALRPTNVTKLENLRHAGLSDYRYITGCATAIRRPLLDFALPFPGSLKAHDHWLHECGHWMNARKVVPESLQYYRRHDKNASDMSISRPYRISRLATQLETLRSDSLQSHRQILVMLCEVRARLTGEPDQASRLVRSNLGGTLISLEAKIQALQERVEVLESAWPWRLCRALRFWLRGGYSNFTGWKSLVNDLLNRRRQN